MRFSRWRRARAAGLRPVRGGLWVWRGPGWSYGPDTPERRAQAVPLDPCPHRVTVPVPGGRLCVSCCSRVRVGEDDGMDKAERQRSDLEPAWMEFVQVAGPGIALLVIGAAVLAAEAWLLTIGTSVLFVAPLMLLTGFTMYVIGSELWEDWRP